MENIEYFMNLYVVGVGAIAFGIGILVFYTVAYSIPLVLIYYTTKKIRDLFRGKT